jgi:hypothetical protein
MAIWNILWRFGIFYNHLVHFVFIWYIFSGFGIMYQEKSGNPALLRRFRRVAFDKRKNAKRSFLIIRNGPLQVELPDGLFFDQKSQF